MVLKAVINIGILGFGTVGSGTIGVLLANQADIEKSVGCRLEIRKVADVDLDRPRPVSLPGDILTANAYEVINDPAIDIVVEAIGGLEPAREYVLSALRGGKNVVSSNKELIAKCGGEIFKVAEEKGVDIYFEGSVGGGIPIIRPLKESLAGDRVEEIIGIVNGTTNYILTKMSLEGRDFVEVLREAQEKGYAERDPTDDIEGYDAAYKIAILGAIAFGSKVEPKQVYKEGISKITQRDIEYANEFGYVVKLLAIANDTEEGLEFRVHPALLPAAHPLAGVRDAFNAIFVKGAAVGELMFYGRGAGGQPTGSALAGDIVEIARNINHGATGRISYAFWEDKRIKDMLEIITKYYIRMQVVDKPGVLAKIAGVFGDEDVSIASVVQKSRGELAEIVLVTHEAREGNLQKVLQGLNGLAVVSEISNVIRVEEG